MFELLLPSRYRYYTVAAFAVVAFFGAVATPPRCAAEPSAAAAEAEAGVDVEDKQDKADVTSKEQDQKADSTEAPHSKEAKADSRNGDGKESKEAKDSAAKKKTDTESKDKASARDSAKSEEKTKREKVRLALFTLKDALPESSGQVGPFGDTQLDLREVLNRFEKASKDKSISGMVLDIQNPAIGRGKVEELCGAIARFRAAGKKVYAMMESGMPADYLIASACDEIVMPESGVLMLPGVHAEAMFYKKLLSKLGVEADFIHIGEFKGAAEPMMREDFSPPVRENLTSLIDSLYDDLVSTIVKNRPISIAEAKEIIDTGLLTAKRAKEVGLIDRIAYPEALRDELAKSYDAESLVYVQNYGQKDVDADFSGPAGLLKLMQSMMGSDTSSRTKRGKKVAIIYAVGPIMSGKSQSDIFGSQVMGSTTIVEALREASKDDDVIAIVLRVDSPGGSAIASDMIWNETQVIKKPIVASMGDVAASGGYYISMGADKIFATPGTVTGSIGVVGGKLAYRGLYEKVGITTETIERGKNSGLFSSSGKFSESQRTVVQNMMEDIYGQFTSKAAKGRNMPLDELRKLAGGRVYTGRQAKENGLIDELGTLEDSIAAAKKLAGLEDDADVKIEVLPEPINFLETLFGDVEAEREVRMAESVAKVSPELMQFARRIHRLRTIFNQPVVLMMPYELEIR